MNKAEAENILNEFASAHTNFGRYGWSYGDSHYDAEFNIKMYYSSRFYGWRKDLPEVQQEFLDSNELYVYERELESFIDLTVLEDKYPPESCWCEGRSGGWLVCRWYAPENGRDAIRLAHAIKRLDAAVREGKDYVSSIEFWQDHLDANCPVRVLEGCGL